MYTHFSVFLDTLSLLTDLFHKDTDVFTHQSSTLVLPTKKHFPSTKVLRILMTLIGAALVAFLSGPVIRLNLS